MSLSLSSEYKPSSSRTFCGERVALKLLSLRFTHLVCVASRYFHSLGRVGVSRWGWVLQIKFPCHSKQRLSREGYRATDQRRAFLPATVSTSGRIHGEMLRVLYLLATKRLPRSSGTSASRMMSAPRHIAGVGGGLEFYISAYCSVWCGVEGTVTLNSPPPLVSLRGLLIQTKVLTCKSLSRSLGLCL